MDSLAAVPLRVIDPSVMRFGPRPLGFQFEVVLNATSFSSILNQLFTISKASIDEQQNTVPSPISLLSGGCFSSLNGTVYGEPNCTAACADPMSMFNSTFTFWNCLTLGATSLMQDNGSLTVNKSSIQSVGRAMGFTDLSDFKGGDILQNTLSCVQQSCQDYDLGTCPMSITRLNISSSTDPVNDLFNGLQDYCDGSSSIVNSDLAGPGVVLSYILQAAVSIAFFVLSSVFTTWLQPILWPFIAFSLYRSGTPSPMRLAWQMAADRQRKLSRSRPAMALVSALVEFQEVQGFFVAAIQLATLAVFASTDSAALLSSISSFGEAVLNAEVAQTLSINGVLPILFIQISLLRSGIRWWYMTSIVVLVFILSLVVLTMDLEPDSSALWTYFKESGPIGACGGNPSPMTYCLDSLGTLTDVLKPLGDGIVLGCMAIVMFIHNHTWHPVSRWLEWDQLLDVWETTNYKVLILRRRIWPIGSVILWTVLELGLLVYVGLYLHALITIMERVSTDSSQWTYGQLVAVMVWAPVLGKYIYFNIFGVEEGIGKRMAPQYKIVQELTPHDTEPESPVDEKNEHGIDMVIFRAESLNPHDSRPHSKIGTGGKREAKSTYVRRRHHSDVSNAEISKAKYGQQ